MHILNLQLTAVDSQPIIFKVCRTIIKLCNVTCSELVSAYVAVGPVKNKSRHDVKYCGVHSCNLAKQHAASSQALHYKDLLAAGKCHMGNSHSNIPVVARQNMIGSVVNSNLESLYSRASIAAELPPQHVILPRPEALMHQGCLELVHMPPPVPLP